MVDFGQEVTGYVEINVEAYAGDVVELSHAEVLDKEGNFYTENYRSAKAKYRYICKDGRQTYNPKLTIFGFRYIRIDSFPGGVQRAKPENFTAVTVHSQMKRTGYLRCSNALLNKLFDNVVWGQKGNFLDVPTDCPLRDERTGWTGDAQVFSPTASFFRNTYNFYRKYLHDMDTEQQDLQGRVPIVVPSFGYDDTACVWGDAVTIMPWNLYLFTGDKAILQEQYGSMKAWVDYLVRFDGEDRRWGKVFHYGDWLALDHADRRVDQSLGGTAEDYIAYVYFGHSAGLVAKAAALLGKEEDAAHYAALKESIYDYVRREFFTPAGRCAADTQTAYIIALRYGLAPHREKAVQMLKKTFARNQNKLQTGFVGSPHLCNVLTEVGMEKLSYDLLLNEGYPGWLYEVNLGATTIWERWNSMEADGSVSSTGMNSFNHYSYGSICEWMFRHAAGLNPREDVPGFRKVELKPVPDPRLGHVEMEYRSASGTYRVCWKTEGNRHVKLDVTVPFGCEAELTLYRSGKAPVTLTAGTYHYEYDTVTPMGSGFTADTIVQELLDNAGAARLLHSYNISHDNLPTQYWNAPLRHVSEDAPEFLTPEQLAVLEKRLMEL